MKTSLLVAIVLAIFFSSVNAGEYVGKVKPYLYGKTLYLNKVTMSKDIKSSCVTR